MITRAGATRMLNLIASLLLRVLAGLLPRLHRNFALVYCPLIDGVEQHK